MLYFDINIWSVIAVAVASIIIGMLWYGPIFGKVWTKLMGFDMSNKEKMAEMKKKAQPAYIGQAITSLIAAFVLASLVLSLNIGTYYEAIKLSFFLWLGFHGPVLLNQVFWAGKPVRLWQIDASYHLVNLLVAALILVTWS